MDRGLASPLGHDTLLFNRDERVIAKLIRYLAEQKLRAPMRLLGTLPADLPMDFVEEPNFFQDY